RPDAEADRARGEFAGNLEDPGSTAGADEILDPDEILDEDAIERFGRDLENDELAARAAAENEDDDEDEAGVVAASTTPF
ncbi:MAG TPA: hypothetical protein VF162_19235, partial [Streptosporangiaceae bacterium]